MTVDEIFSSESEHLYFRLIAARNALNAANDNETRQVLNEILDDTLNNISRIGTDEEIAAAEEIVVRKSNKNVKDYLSCQKFSLIASAVAFVAIVISVLALILIIVGANNSKVKAIITVVLIGGGISAMALLVASYMKKRMATAKESLKGKTVIGARIDTGVKSTATKTAASYTPAPEPVPAPAPAAPAAPAVYIPGGNSSSAANTSYNAAPAADTSYAPAPATATAPAPGRPTVSRPAPAARPKNERTASKKQKGPKVVRNYFGFLKVLITLAVVAVLAFLVYTNWAKIELSIKNIMYNVGLTDPAPEYNLENYNALRKQLAEVRNGIYYNEAEKIYQVAVDHSKRSEIKEAAAKFSEAAEVYLKCSDYRDADAKRVDSKNYEYYYQAQLDVEQSIHKAKSTLSKIVATKPEFKYYGRALNLTDKYSSYIAYVGTYEGGGEKFSITDFAMKDSTLSIEEARMGWKKVEPTVDREGYKYLVIEKKGETEVKWYIAEDHVLKVSEDGNKTLKR